MLARDLMIGDWVKTPDGLYRMSYISLFELRYQKYCNGLCAVELRFKPADVEPIPLTPEILKANGFGETGMTFFKEIEKDVFLTYDTAENIAEIPSAFGDIKMRIEYVHTLQHALRLAGIEEIANNFKTQISL